MIKYLNYEALLEGACYFLFSVMMFFLAWSGNYLIFVTPKMGPYLYFTAAVMLIWSISRFAKVITPKYKGHPLRCLVLLVPVFLIISPHDAVTVTDAAENYNAGFNQMTGSQSAANVLNVGGNTGSAGTSSGTAASADSGSTGGGSEQSSTPAAGPDEDRGDLPPGLDKAGKTIKVTDEKFYAWLIELCDHPEDYEGFQVILHGTVYHDEQSMGENQFAIGRLLMSCCAADLTPFGIPCVWNDAASLEQDKWITVTGTFHYDTEVGAQIKVSKVEDAGPAKDKYVYPF